MRMCVTSRTSLVYLECMASTLRPQLVSKKAGKLIQTIKHDYLQVHLQENYYYLRSLKIDAPTRLRTCMHKPPSASIKSDRRE
jgi:hypothetical protein